MRTCHCVNNADGVSGGLALGSPFTPVGSLRHVPKPHSDITLMPAGAVKWGLTCSLYQAAAGHCQAPVRGTSPAKALAKPPGAAKHTPLCFYVGG